MAKKIVTENLRWSVDDSYELYEIDGWGDRYVGINEVGHVEVRPEQGAGYGIDLKALVDDLGERGLGLPILIRFSDILKRRIETVHGAFGNAIKEYGYGNIYRGVYPIKVNQQRHVVEEMLTYGKALGLGLEAGSKPELLAAMALVDDEDTPIVCNGFKDEEYIEAVILAGKIGKCVIPVVEKFSELKLIVEQAKKHGVRPKIGVRVKLAARGAGRWEGSGGVRSKFGLFVTETLKAVEYLKAEGMADCLELLHFHMGSQINEIRNVKTAVVELARMYVELSKEGVGLKYLDVGGGLGVDYDGSHTAGGSSMNYDLQEYANDIVFQTQQICDAHGVAHPVIISESGRALAAHHSVLVFNVVGSSGFGRFDVPSVLDDGAAKDLPLPIKNLFEAYHLLDEKNFIEFYHDAQEQHEAVIGLFNHGYCTLVQRGLAERLVFGLCTKALGYVREMADVPEEFEGLEQILSETYFCNMSVFQSLPDSWAIGQKFPILPIHRLDEEPLRRGILADITCDSDGRVDAFIGKGGGKDTLALHDLEEGQDYYLAAFMVGAYQETLGDLHNLFGDVNVVHVKMDGEGGVHIDEVIEGDSVGDVLGYVQYDPKELLRMMRKQVERGLKGKRLTLGESRMLLKFYEDGLNGYTYLE